MIKKAIFILYVKDQEASASFYEKLLAAKPTLNVPGMTEFAIGSERLGLMPAVGIKRLLGDALRNPTDGDGIPRCELYLFVDDADIYFRRAGALGARTISPFSQRNWGDRVAYFEDLDGHVVAIADNKKD